MTAPLLFDRAAIRRARERASALGPTADFLRGLMVERLAERILDLRRPLEIVAELGARHGQLRAALAEAGLRPSTYVEMELMPPPQRQAAACAVVGDEALLPFRSGSLDAVLSGGSLHLVNDLPGTLAQARAALGPDGVLLAAFPGGSTLAEWRTCLTSAEIEARGGAAARVGPFVDVRDAGALLQRAGFAMPMVDLERLDIAYASPARLLSDLRAMGEIGILVDKAPHPLGRATLARALEIYTQRFPHPSGHGVSATFEVLLLVGWKPAATQPRPAPRGTGTIDLSRALGRRAPEREP